jgi:hypothetical protein
MSHIKVAGVRKIHVLQDVCTELTYFEGIISISTKHMPSKALPKRLQEPRYCLQCTISRLFM